VEQSDQPQRELIPSSTSNLQQQDTRSLPAQAKDRLAVLAFIEYLRAFQEDMGKELNIPFDNGCEYHVAPGDLSYAIYSLAELVNESLREKTLARFGRRLIGFNTLQFLLRSISSYLGFGNIVHSGDPKGFSLASLLATRPLGMLAPLTDAEEQELTDKTVAAMVKTMQADARGETKQVATTIVADEKVRLNLFLEAMQGTLRFLDKQTRLPQYQELQLSFTNETDRTLLAQQMNALLTSLVDEQVSGEPKQNGEQESSVVESEPLGVAQSVEVVMNSEQSVPDDVIAWLFTNRERLAHPSISSFIDTYLKRLVAAGKEKVTLREDSVIVLPRWKSPEGGSYGYNPTDIMFHLRKLNSLLYEVTHRRYAKDVRLDGEMLLSFSTLFGFYNLCSYFLFCQHEYITHIADEISKDKYLLPRYQHEIATAVWLNQACELLKPFPGIDSWNEDYSFRQWIKPRISGYNDSSRKHYPPSPDKLYWFEQKGNETVYLDSLLYQIVWDEYKRFVAFLNSLRMRLRQRIGNAVGQ
jgi:hypothetical protein